MGVEAVEQRDEKADDGVRGPAAASSSGAGPAAGQRQHAPASWASMPRKGQLALITLARLCESAATSSLQTYMVSQLQSLRGADGSASTGLTLAFQVSALNAVVAGPQLFTSVLWGRLADSRHVGRKSVVVLGLLGTGVASLGLGFADSFAGVMLWRFVVGLVNGNMGVMRAMIKDIGGDEHESRVVLLLPTAFNVGSIVGPAVGSLLAGAGARGWLPRWPYALPNAFNGVCLIACAALLALGLEETLEGVRLRPGRLVPAWLAGARLLGGGGRPRYEVLVDQEDVELGDAEGGGARSDSSRSDSSRSASASPHPPADVRLLSSRIWTPRLLATLVARWLVTLHVGAYPSLLLVFIATPRYDSAAVTTAGHDAAAAAAAAPLVVPPAYRPHAPFTFTGGLSFQPSGIAAALTIRGVVGLLLQLLFFPLFKNYFGLTKLYRYSLLLFPVSYFITPYLATIPSSSLPPLPAAGLLLWTAIALVLTIQTVARSFALPSGTMLLNAASPHPSALGTVNGIGQSVSAAARTLGPLLTAWLYGSGLSHGVVGTAWWAMAAVAVLAAVASTWVVDEDGVKKARG